MGEPGTDNLAFVAVAFTATWIALVGYQFYLRAMLRRASAAYDKVRGAP